ncbi:MAG: hypothetical protein KDA89_05285 [Planctomycetaceae bacterium]|nr:hypothetical protein [Planctomycetaceae bacterium]
MAKRQSSSAGFYRTPAVWVFAVCVLSCPGWLSCCPADDFRAVLVDAQQISESSLRRFAEQGTTTVVLKLTTAAGPQRRLETTAAEQIQKSGLKLNYWIEIARCPELADAHPEWMASLQGHPEWRRLHPDAPHPLPNQVIKNYPWVPILYEESFAAHLRRTEQLLTGIPAAGALFLNGLQGAPSACGCGNSLCRWTADYGPIVTATPLKSPAAAEFVAAVKRIPPGRQVIPVWLTECEKHDCTPDGLCAGVGCFDGICWRAWQRQLTPVAEESELIGAFVPYKLFRRDLPRYGKPGGWIQECVRNFEQIPVVHGGRGIPANRLILFLQGWDVTPEETVRQRHLAEESGVSGYVLMHSPVDQSWSPRLFSLPAN